MTMTHEEIIRDYNQAKAPLKQIKILSEINQCDRDEIVAILRNAGCELPARYRIDETAEYEARIERLKESNGKWKAEALVAQDRVKVLEREVENLKAKPQKDAEKIGDLVFENMKLTDMIVKLVERLLG